MKGWRGYVASRPQDGMFAPQRVQNLVIRDYVMRKSGFFALSATEYSMPNCYMILDALLEDLADTQVIVFYSTHLLPENATHRQKLYNAILRQKCELHFALEDLQVKSPADATKLEDVINIRRIMEQHPTHQVVAQMVNSLKL